MITYNTPLYQSLALLHYTAPVVQAAGSVTTTAVDMGEFNRLLFVVDVGVVTSGTVDFKLRASATSAGTYTDVANFAITQITTSSHVAYVEISSEQLVAAETAAGTGSLYKYRWVEGVLTVGGTSAAIAIHVFGAHGRFKPEYLARTGGGLAAIAGNVTALDQIISPKSSTTTAPPAG